jgi:hypothetical protein
VGPMRCHPCHARELRPEPDNAAVPRSEGRDLGGGIEGAERLPLEVSQPATDTDRRLRSHSREPSGSRCELTLKSTLGLILLE